MVRSPLDIPEIVLPEALCTTFALFLRDKCNQAFGIFREVASGRDLKKFLYVIFSFFLSIQFVPNNSCHNFVKFVLKKCFLACREFWAYGLRLLLAVGLIS